MQQSFGNDSNNYNPFRILPANKFIEFSFPVAHSYSENGEYNVQAPKQHIQMSKRLMLAYITWIHVDATSLSNETRINIWDAININKMGNRIEIECFEYVWRIAAIIDDEHTSD